MAEHPRLFTEQVEGHVGKCVVVKIGRELIIEQFGEIQPGFG